MPQVTITVLNSKLDMSYNPSVLHVSANDNILWNTGPDTGAFKLTFRGNSPLNEGLVRESGADNTVTGTVKVGAAGVYYYSVSAIYTPTGAIAVDPGCPEIIVK